MDRIKKAITNPKSALNFVRDRSRRVIYKQINRRYGVQFLERDWDNLVLLDGCRYDVFKDSNTIEGELSMIRSNASSSPEFFANNFAEKELGDVVYFSANTFIDRTDVYFHEIFRLWESHWNDDTGTVLPKDVTDCVLKEEERFRDKRIIIHYMQPHKPFLGPTEKEIESQPIGANLTSKRTGEVITRTSRDPWWERMERGELDRETVWKAYVETLELTLPHVQRLVEGLPGKTVISADHGNAFGESGIYGHPKYLSHNSLVNVPWLEIDDKRKTIREGRAAAHGMKNSDIPEEKLRSLGYLD